MIPWEFNRISSNFTMLGPVPARLIFFDPPCISFFEAFLVAILAPGCLLVTRVEATPAMTAGSRCMDQTVLGRYAPFPCSYAVTPVPVSINPPFPYPGSAQNS